MFVFSGCVGGVCGLANVLGEECCELQTLYTEGRHSEAQALQHRLVAPNIGVSCFISWIHTTTSILGGGHIIFAFSGVCRPLWLSAVCCPLQLLLCTSFVSGHFKEKYLTYLYQIWYEQ